MHDDEEEWRPVTGYEGLYEVSNHARVRGLDRTHVTKSGVTRQVKGRELRQLVSKRGYLTVALHNHGQKTKVVHRLVAEAFIPNPRNLPVVRHLNDIQLDNRVGNLAWGTQKDNLKDAFRNGKLGVGLWAKSECVHGHLYTEENTYRDPRGRRRCRACRREDDIRARITRQMGA